MHHIRGHIAACYLATELVPFLCLVVSGAQPLVEVLDYTRFRVIGRTWDDGGRGLDKAAG